MIKVFFGKKGMGKTKLLIDAANKMSEESTGDVVFIDDSTQLMYDLKHRIRFVNVSDFPVKGQAAFLGFICGIISEDFDIEGIFIDGLTYIADENVSELKGFFDNLEALSKKYNIKFYLSINGDNAAAPDYLKAYIENVV
ncbi:MAG: hypothetical protein N2489_07645 [Clostridia bacterium]|nr:hypothetical protein [Clostridia bacterium]